MELWCRKTKGTCRNYYSSRKQPDGLCVSHAENFLFFLHRVSIPFASNGIFIEKEAGYYKISSDEHGFVVKIDASGNIQILLQEKHYNKTCGLCGNFNKFLEDDFRTREGKLTTNWLYFNGCTLFLLGDSTEMLLIQQKCSYRTCQVPQLGVLKSCPSSFIFISPERKWL